MVICAILPATHEDSRVAYCIEMFMKEVGLRFLRPVGKPIEDNCEAQVAMDV